MQRSLFATVLCCLAFSTVSYGANKAPFDLRVLHINDHHSHIEPSSLKLKLGEDTIKVKAGGFPAIISKFKQLEAKGGNILKLHAGDAITGTLYFSLFEGKVDADMMNQICFDAFALGNHEFDRGDAGLKQFLDALAEGECNTDVLAANVKPEVGKSPLTPKSSTDSFKPYTTKEINGEKIGIIGLVIAGKTKNSSSPDATTEFLHEANTAQQYIDELQQQGINKIILLTHYQYANEVKLAQTLKGVDLVVGGDSHTLLGNNFQQFGLNPGGEYPTVVKNADGQKACVVQAWQYSSVVGELNVSFDADGHITQCAGIPHLLLSDNMKLDKEALSGDKLTAVNKIIEATPELSIVQPDAVSSKLLANYKAQVDELKNDVIGQASEDLCLERIPGQGKSSMEGCKEKTLQHGSEISDLVSKGFLMMSKTSDICIQNGGGVRTDVPQGDISIDTAYTLLPFANTLVELDMTGQQILDVLEEAVDYALDEKGSTGAYPYASGLRWKVDLSKTMGQRFSDVEINSRLAGEWQALDPKATYKVVSNNYIAGGKDGYLTFGDLPKDKKVDTYLDYAQSFVEYVSSETNAGRKISALPMAERSTQACLADANKKFCTGQ